MWVNERSAGKVKAQRDAGGLRRKLGVGGGGAAWRCPEGAANGEESCDR